MGNQREEREIAYQRGVNARLSEPAEREMDFFSLGTFPSLPVTNEGSPWRNRSSGRGKDRQPTKE